MRIEKLTLRGFLRFRDVVSIDLTDVPSGLVALVGPNGSGKTTLLEAAPAALFRSFMSRGELVDYATGRDSFIEAQFSVDGRGTFRARINVDGPKRNSDAVLEAVQPDGSRRVLNDGKVSTFDQAVAREFPSKELLLASSFASQNKAGSFITLDKKRRKDLFAQLLGIERYAAMSDTARQAASFIEQSRGRLQVRRELLERETGDRTREELDRLQVELEAAEAVADSRRDDVRSTIARLEARLATMADAVAAYASAHQRRTTLQTELASRQVDRQALTTDASRSRAELEREQQRIADKRASDLLALEREVRTTDEMRDRELQDAAARRDVDLSDLDKKVAGNRQLQDRAAEIRAAADTSRQVAADIAACDERLEAHLAEATQLRTRLSELDAEIAALAVPTEQLARAKADAALLASVPCGGIAGYAACQFLTNAKEAEGRIPQLANTVAERAELDHRHAQLQAHLDVPEAKIIELRASLAGLKRQQASLAALTAYAAPLAAAEARIAELGERRGQTLRDFDAATAAALARHTTRHDELLDRRTAVLEQERLDLLRVEQREADLAVQFFDKAAALDATIARLTGELARAEADVAQTGVANSAAERAQEDLRTERAAWDAVTATLARVESGRQELYRRRDAFARRQHELADVDGRMDRLTTELLEWQLLAKAFGRDGLPVLEIDAAGPTISAYTNELLEVCFGPRFSVELVTQRAKADGKGYTDDFSIRVLDNQRGGEGRDIADLSGGEQVIVAEALSNAICIYVNTRSPMPVRTCWRDETTGALDPENATRYLAMLRKVQELGGFAHVLFISHNPDAAAQADAQIQLADGKAAVVFPPYAMTEAA